MPVPRDFPMARLLIRLLPALGAAAVVVPAAIAIGQSAPEGTPLLPDLDQATPSGLVVTHAGSGSRRSWRLGFRSAVGNVGDGPLLIEGRRARDERAMAATQVIQREGAPMEEVPAAGRLRYVRSPDHEHWHLLGFDRYELRRPGGRRALVEDRKSGFCLGDRYPVSAAPPSRAPQPVFRSRCGLQQPGLLGIREGISVGYGDDYAANLEGQWLPLDGLRAGRYLLVHRVNADRRLRETSYANNAASLLLRLRWRDGGPFIDILAECPDTARCRG
jgi:Lysyl oxidase